MSVPDLLPLAFFEFRSTDSPSPLHTKDTGNTDSVLGLILVCVSISMAVVFVVSLILLARKRGT